MFAGLLSPVEGRPTRPGLPSSRAVSGTLPALGHKWKGRQNQQVWLLSGVTIVLHCHLILAQLFGLRRGGQQSSPLSLPPHLSLRGTAMGPGEHGVKTTDKGGNHQACSISKAVILLKGEVGGM